MTPRPGARNLNTDVEDITVGHVEDCEIGTGVTVVRPNRAAVCAVDVRGGATQSELIAPGPACSRSAGGAGSASPTTENGLVVGALASVNHTREHRLLPPWQSNHQPNGTKRAQSGAEHA